MIQVNMFGLLKRYNKYIVLDKKKNRYILYDKSHAKKTNWKF